MIAKKIPKIEKKHLNRVWDRVEKTSHCWLWTGKRQIRGYGVFYYMGKEYRAHRVVWELQKGSIGKGLVLDHICKNTSCVNPVHLEPVTQRENIKRAERSSYCSRGHLFNIENTSYYNGHRRCRECNRLRAQENRNLKKCFKK